METSKTGVFVTSLLVTASITVVIALMIISMPSASTLVVEEGARVATEAAADPSAKEAEYQRATQRSKCPPEVSACASYEKYKEKWRDKK